MDDDESRDSVTAAITSIPANGTHYVAGETSLAISIVRIQGRFDHLPQAHRLAARRPHHAVRRLLVP